MIFCTLGGISPTESREHKEQLGVMLAEPSNFPLRRVDGNFKSDEAKVVGSKDLCFSITCIFLPEVASPPPFGGHFPPSLVF